MVQCAYNVLTLLQVGICDGGKNLQCTYTVARTFTVASIYIVARTYTVAST